MPYVKKAARSYVYEKIRPYYFSAFNYGVFPITICNSECGFFAQLSWCLFILSFCYDKNLIPCISLTGSTYVDPKSGGNWFRYFFEIPDLSPYITSEVKKNKIMHKACKVTDIGQLFLSEKYFTKMTVSYASELAKKYILVNSNIQEKVDIYSQKYFQGRFVLGIHYRGTDKRTEAPRVPWEYVKEVVNNYLRIHSEVDCLFVSSDEGLFIDYTRNQFQSLPVFSHEDQVRSDSDEAFHLINYGKDNFKKGEEALINCLLLSRCNVLIRTTSFLSAWSSIFSPDLPIVLLNSPYKDKLWFPEKELVSRSMSEYV